MELNFNERNLHPLRTSAAEIFEIGEKGHACARGYPRADGKTLLIQNFSFML